MKVVLFHPVRLPPRDYGGTERVVSWLARGLVERGHETWVAALPGSQLPEGARLLEIDPAKTAPEMLRERLPSGTEVVHFMAPPGDGAIDGLPCASIVTVHGNGKSGESFPRNTVFLSRDHASRHDAAHFVYNGIDPSELEFNPSRERGDLIFLSRTGWRLKNVRGAISLCAKAGEPLQVAGGHRPWGVRLRAAFTPKIRWIGPIAGRKKAEFIARGQALVFPVLWDEPFGLVVAEALMSGTPVLATARGSLPELLSPETGALLPDPREGESAWVAAIQGTRARWEPEACRERAMRLFHYARMSENYEKLYRRVAGGEWLHESPPHTLAHTEARGALR